LIGVKLNVELATTFNESSINEFSKVKGKFSFAIFTNEGVCHLELVLFSSFASA
jgi:hypothetical protein